jgi:hypothetical protein
MRERILNTVFLIKTLLKTYAMPPAKVVK